MSTRAINAPLDQADQVLAFVWFNGSGALKEGQGVCYNWDYGTAATAEPRRYNEVELPTILNARHFAGVAARNYAAVTGGQFIEIFLPGSVCNIWSTVSNTIGVGLSTCIANDDDTTGQEGFFGEAGFEGAGSAVPLQTVDRSSTAGLCLAYLQPGPPSGLIERVLAVDNTAITCMVGGVTYFQTAVTLGAGNSTFTLADGTVPGLKKAFVCQAAMTTNDIVITVTSGLQSDGSTALATVSLDADLEEIVLQWDAFDTAGRWVEQHSVGATKA